MFGKTKNEILRGEKYKALCHNKNLLYLDMDEFGTKNYLRYFDIFKRNGTIRNLSHKKTPSLDTEIYLFDYKYVQSTGKSARVFDQTIFFINSKKLGLPEFKISPEHLGHKIAAFLGWEDIDFEEYPVFSDKYHVTGDDEEYIRHVFNDKVLKFFSKTSGWTIEAANYFLIFYAHNSLVPPNILMDFYRLGLGIFEMFELESES